MSKLIESKAVQQSPFARELANEKNVINLNGNLINKAYYNLIVSVRDFKLFAAGIKPHSAWRFKDTKAYFGITGNAANAASQISQLRDEVKALMVHN